MLADFFRREFVQAAQYLYFLIADRIRVGVDRRLHRDDRQQLQQMVLHHVAQGAGVVVEIAARLDPDLFRDRDLHVLDPLAVPQRFQEGIGKA